MQFCVNLESLVFVLAVLLSMLVILRRESLCTREVGVVFIQVDKEGEPFAKFR
jgi:hypothetical protein